MWRVPSGVSGIRKGIESHVGPVDRLERECLESGKELKVSGSGMFLGAHLK